MPLTKPAGVKRNRTAALLCLGALAGACGGDDLASATRTGRGRRTFSHTPAPAEPAPADTSARPTPVQPHPAPTRTQPQPVVPPPYPLVLAHGFFVGSRVGPVEYWWGIPKALREAGERVYVSSEEPLRTPQERAVELAETVDRVLRETRAAKVNLIAHSMGGLDARVLISGLGYGDRIASLTTIGTPHRGSPVADAILGLAPDFAEEDVGAFVNVLGEFVDGDEQNALEAARIMETRGAEAFNAQYRDDPRVAYFSVVGRTTADPLFLVNEVDFCDAGLWSTFTYLRLKGLQNDGLVPVESQRWGEVVATIDADHYNEIGQLLGVVGFAFNPWEFYAEHARFLHARGF